MTLIELLALMLAVVAGWLFWANLQAREAANAAIREACRMHGLLLLNDTVGLEALRFLRDGRGRLRLTRVYGFEYSDTGKNRRRGSVTMIGDFVDAVEVAAPDATEEGETLH